MTRSLYSTELLLFANPFACPRLDVHSSLYLDHVHGNVSIALGILVELEITVAAGMPDQLVIRGSHRFGSGLHGGRGVNIAHLYSMSGHGSRSGERTVMVRDWERGVG